MAHLIACMRTDVAKTPFILFIWDGSMEDNGSDMATHIS